MTLASYHQSLGATLAADEIPLRYADLATEYEAAQTASVLLDRSHEGRIRLSGKTRFELLNRMSTNKLLGMAAGEGRATIFTNTNARILERILAYNRADHLLLLTQPGRAAAFRNWLQKHIFFNDDAQLQDITAETVQFTLHGPTADAVIQAALPAEAALPGKPLHSVEQTLADVPVFLARRKPFIGAHWALIGPREAAVALHQALMDVGQAHGLQPAGSLTYNTLRIQAGQPAGRELSKDYIPLEVGLWDEVHFEKGCYTGQEIIARMESRSRLARTLVALDLPQYVEAPALVFVDNKPVGTLTSSAQAPDGAIFAMAVLKTAYSAENTPLQVGDGKTSGRVMRLLGAQPHYIADLQGAK